MMKTNKPMLNATWGCIKKTRHLLKWPQITLSFVFSYRFLRWWAPCRQEVWNFQLSVGVKASLVESQQMSSFVFISFHRLSFCIHVLSCSVATMLRIKDTGLRKLICSNRSGGYPPKRPRFFFHISLSFLLSFSYLLEACAGCHLQASWTCTCISSLSFFYSYRLLGRQCIGSVKVQATRKWNARGYETTPLDGFVHLKLITSWGFIPH